MDSLTQLVLGSAVGEAVLGKKIGRKASLYGAVLGTLPDLDVFIPANPVNSFVEHRSWSHSIFVLFIVAALLALLFTRWHKKDQLSKDISYGYWLFATYLILVTHPLLDWCTTYGTQLLWPLNSYPYGISNIFIIDPLYTLPLLAAVLWTLITRWRVPVKVGLFYSCSYLLLAFILQTSQNQRFTEHLQQNNIQTTHTLTQAMPLNILLWKNIAMVDGGYWVSFGSVFDLDSDLGKGIEGDAIKSQFFVSDNYKLEQITDKTDIQRLQHFTKGFYQIKELDNELWLSDLRMGGFGRFVFNFKVGEKSTVEQNFQLPETIESKSFRSDADRSKDALKAIFNRIINSKEDLFKYFEGASLLTSSAIQ